MMHGVPGRHSGCNSFDFKFEKERDQMVATGTFTLIPHSYRPGARLNRASDGRALADLGRLAKTGMTYRMLGNAGRYTWSSKGMLSKCGEVNTTTSCESKGQQHTTRIAFPRGAHTAVVHCMMGFDKIQT